MLSPAPPPPPASPDVPAPNRAGAQQRAYQRIRGRARTGSLLVVLLVALTAAAYTGYMAEALHDEGVVLGDQLHGYTYNTTSGTTTTETTVPASNSTNSSLGGVSISAYQPFLSFSSIVDIVFVWAIVGVTAYVLLLRSPKKDPARVLDVLYLDLLLGVVFWPVAALGVVLGPVSGPLMVFVGFLPAVVLTAFVGRSAEEGVGNKVLFGAVLGGIACVMIANAILWSPFVSGTYLLGVVVAELAIPALYVVVALVDRIETIQRRPLVAELLVWSTLGIVLSALVGAVGSGGFSGVGSPLLAASSLFSGTTYPMGPYTSSTWSVLIPGNSLVSAGLPALFGLLGILTAVLTLWPLVAWGDLHTVDMGVATAEECLSCKRAYTVLKNRYTPLCPRCSLKAIARPTAKDRAAMTAAPPPVPPPPS